MIMLQVRLWAVILLLLLSSGCFGCLTAGKVGWTYLTNREEFNACVGAIREQDRREQALALLEPGRVDMTPEERIQAFRSLVHDLKLEDECGPVLDLLKDQLPSLPSQPDAEDDKKQE